MSEESSTAEPLSVKAMFRDEHTSDALPHDHICEAMSDEIRYILDNVLTLVPRHGALADSYAKLIPGRWANSNKRDAAHPNAAGGMPHKTFAMAPKMPISLRRKQWRLRGRSSHDGPMKEAVPGRP